MPCRTPGPRVVHNVIMKCIDFCSFSPAMFRSTGRKTKMGIQLVLRFTSRHFTIRHFTSRFKEVGSRKYVQEGVQILAS